MCYIITLCDDDDDDDDDAKICKRSVSSEEGVQLSIYFVFTITIFCFQIQTRFVIDTPRFMVRVVTAKGVEDLGLVDPKAKGTI